MPTAHIGVDTRGGREVEALRRRLIRAGSGALLRQLERRLRDEARPTVLELQAAARWVQVTSTKGGHVDPDRSTGLRRTTAAATDLSVWDPAGDATGVRFFVSAQKMRAAGYPGDIAKYLDASIGNYRRWAHPVFGQVSVWTVQRGSPWFFNTIERALPRIRRAVHAVVVDIRDQITD